MNRKTSVELTNMCMIYEGKIFWMPLEELRKAENNLWHLYQMLELFCGNTYSELYFNRNDSAIKPTLK